MAVTVVYPVTTSTRRTLPNNINRIITSSSLLANSNLTVCSSQQTWQRQTSLRLFYDLLGIEKEEQDYGSNVESKVSMPVRDDKSRQASNLFIERRAVDALTALHTTPNMVSAIITNPLDEEQVQVL